MLNGELPIQTATVVLSKHEFEKMKDNAVVFSGHCRHLTENKIDACFHKNVPIHVRDNLKSVCFSNSFDVSIENTKNKVFFSSVPHKEIKNITKATKMFMNLCALQQTFHHKIWEANA